MSRFSDQAEGDELNYKPEKTLQEQTLQELADEMDALEIPMTICKECKHANNPVLTIDVNPRVPGSVYQPFPFFIPSNTSPYWTCKANPIGTNVVTGQVFYRRCDEVNFGACGQFEHITQQSSKVRVMWPPIILAILITIINIWMFLHRQ